MHTNRGGEESVVHPRQKGSQPEITKGRARRSRKRGTREEEEEMPVDVRCDSVAIRESLVIHPIVEATVHRPRRNKNAAMTKDPAVDRRSDWRKSFAGPFRSSGTVLRSRGVRPRWPISDSCRFMRYPSLIVPFET